MCGRFSQIKSQQELEKYFGRQMQARFRGPNYNVAPTQSVPVVTAEGIEEMRWGLVPQWAKSLNVGYSMINAVSETLTEKITYRKPLKYQRCLVPASGFYEWMGTPAGKIPYYFRLKGREIFGFAGLWVSRRDSEGVELKSFTIITTRPNAVVEPVHNRMPVILRREDESVWLDPAVTDEVDLLSLCQPYEADDMSKYPVGKDVGNVRNNGPDLIVPQV